MTLDIIFEEQPMKWGLRGDPYFWDYLRNIACNMDLISPKELEKWIKEEYLKLTGNELTRRESSRVEMFAHGGMSSGGVSGHWWVDTGIPLLKKRLKEIIKKGKKGIN